MSYDRALDVRECVRKALGELPTQLTPARDLHALFDYVENVTRVDASGYEVMNALREIDEGAYAVFVEMLVGMYLEAEADSLEALAYVEFYCGHCDEVFESRLIVKSEARCPTCREFCEACGSNPDEEDDEIAFQ